MKSNKIRQLTERIFFLPPEQDTDRPILAAIRGKQKTLLVDAGNSAQHASLFLKQLGKEDISNIQMVVLTHWHWDHSFGADELNVVTIAHEQTKWQLQQLIPLSWSDDALHKRVLEGSESPFCAEMIKKEYGNNRHITIALPNITFKEKIHLDLGDISCRVEHVGGDHSHDSSVIFVEEEKVLFLGDCLYPHLYSEKPIYTVHNVLSLVEQLNTFDADTYVLSHELPLTKSQFQHYTRLLTLLCHCTKEKAGNRHEMIDALTTQLSRELNQSELAAVDCFANGVRA